MLAWRLDPKPATPDGSLKERFNCNELCTRKCSPGLLNPQAQAKRNCTLPHFDRRRWTGELTREAWMGLPEEPAVIRCRRDHDCGDVAERPAVPRPHEDVAKNGCPGGWYRTPFIDSILRYRREPLEGGARVENLLLSRCDDELVLEAVRVLENFENAWTSEHLHQIRLKHQKERAHV